VQDRSKGGEQERQTKRASNSAKALRTDTMVDKKREIQHTVQQNHTAANTSSASTQ
jgi:hypothetical protein